MYWSLSRMGGITAVWQPIIDTDLNQHRLDIGVLTPRNEQVIQQQFVPRWDGLSEVELLLVRYGEAEEAVNGRLTFQLLDDTNTVVAEETLETVNYDHNQVYKLAVPVQSRSAGRTYTLRHVGGVYSCSCPAWRNQSIPCCHSASISARRFVRDAHLRWVRSLATQTTPSNHLPS